MRIAVITIDVSEVTEERSMHPLLMRELGFPGFYGMKWDAFWDGITALVRIPDHVRFPGWDQLVADVPRGAANASAGARQLPSRVPAGVCR
ncbi:barstar family protein [Streptomyces sp. NPDC058964]|uniref:barstar family protein n=1 Tax=Streptomyces sp. NPDC058964 TaxID=3346681 RepID=UPI0036CDD566